MTTLRLSEAAQADLVDIRLYSNSQFGAGATDAYMRGFKQVFRRLRQYPNFALAVDDLAPDLRCAVHRSHQIFYCVEKDMILIVRILHHAQNAPRHITQ